MRVVTTIPSATEIVATLGLEPVGVSHECDDPPDVTDVPSVTQSRIDASGSSAAIDRQVLEASAAGGVYDVDVETLEALDPDLVITQGLCDVCAVDAAVVREAVDRSSIDPAILPVDPHTVADVLDDIRRIGGVTGREAQAAARIADLEARIETVRVRTATLDGPRPRVAIFDWTEPVMLAGHWTAELVGWAGGEYPVSVGEASRPHEWEEILEYDPEVIVVAPCGFDLAQTAANRADLTERPGWDDLTAVRTGRVWALDGDQYLNRPGPRLVDTLDALAPIVRPEAFEADEIPDDSIAVPFDELERHGNQPEHRVGSGTER